MKKMHYISLFFIMFFGVSLSMEDQDIVLSTPQAHDNFIRKSLKIAHTRVIIVSPFISSLKLSDNSSDSSDGLSSHIRRAIDRGVDVCVFTDNKFDRYKPNGINGRSILATLGVDVKIVSRLHSKNLIIDDDYITFGSFNWLAAITNPQDQFCRYETTTVLCHPQEVDKIISRVRGDLMERTVTSHQGSFSLSLLDIEEDKQVDYALQLYRKHSTQPHYKQLAEHVICNYICNCYDLKEGLGILRAMEGIEGSESTIIWAAYTVLPSYCERASHFISLAEILIRANQPEKAVKVAENIFTLNREKELDSLIDSFHSLNAIGLKELSSKFEEYISCGTTDGRWSSSPNQEKYDHTNN